jgi:SAM-dependent methyltransferase
MINPKYATHKREPFFELARPYIEENSKVLDIGCGHAAFAKYFDRTDFYLFDGNESTIKDLKTQYNNVFYGVLPKLPFDDSQFDVIHCSHVVEHLDAEILYQTINEMNRCLKPGGVLVISAPLMWSGFYNDLSHLRPYSPYVFTNYLCLSNQINRTREVIKEAYHVDKLVYRFKQIKPLHSIYFHGPRIFAWVLKAWFEILNKLGYKSYEKTGFTLVLKKQ